MPITTDGRFCGPCFHCQTQMWLPQELYDAAKRSSKITFYCAYGHPQVFAEGETEFDKVRRERDRLKQQTAQLEDSVKYWTAQTDKERKEVSKLRAEKRRVAKRVGNGTCPCCNRTFSQLARHMASKHPRYKAEAAA